MCTWAFNEEQMLTLALQTVDITYQEGVGANTSSNVSTKDHEDIVNKMARSSLDETAPAAKK